MKQPKYQFKENKNISHFNSKNDFIEFCQSKYNECFNVGFSGNSFQFFYSFDYGKNWSHIKKFKEEIKIIQNQRDSKYDNKTNVSTLDDIEFNIYENDETLINQNQGNSESDKKDLDYAENKSTGFFTYLLYVLVIWGGLSLINKNFHKIDFVNQINNKLFNKSSISTTANSNQTSNELNSSELEEDLPYDSAGAPKMTDHSETTTTTTTNQNNDNYDYEISGEASNNYSSNSNNNSSTNTYQQPEKQKQWVNCSYCHGSGLVTCNSCGGKGIKQCSRCFGKGIWTWDNNKTCYECGGRGEKKCNDCYGKGNRGSCLYCNGRGQIQVTN